MLTANMDFRICIFLFAASLSYSEQCEKSYDKNKCSYNLVCKDTLDINDWESFNHNLYDLPDCPLTYTYGYHKIDPIYLVFQDTYKNPTKLIPTSEDFVVNHIIHSLDLSGNYYTYTPVLQTMSNLKILDLSKNLLTKAVLSNTNNLDKLRELDLFDNTINSIEVHSQLYPYTTLQKINMSHNELQKIPDAVFEEFNQLQTLDLSRNLIENLTHTSFEGLTQLLHLNLSNNRLTGIGSSLCELSKLKLLNLSGNKIKDVRVSDFEKLTKLEELDLSSNFIDTIELNVFHGMVVLHTLDLSNNILPFASKEVFANLQSLTNIDLSRNQIKSLPISLFKNKTINTFSISDNFLEGPLAKGMFEGINVTTLDLSNQRLTGIQDYAFYELIRLETLLLNNNKIESLSIMCFKTLKRLEQLDLSNNQIVSIDFNKDDLGSLRSLLVNNNQLVKIKQDAFQQLSNLEYLDLSANDLSRFEPGTFKNLSNLINLGVSGNLLIGSLESDTFGGLVSLPSLDISFSALTTVQNASFNAMSELKELNMSHSKINELQYNAFVNTGNVETLDLSYNEIKNLFINMTDLVGLGTLLLNNNHLKSIDTCLQGLLKLSKLNLAYNEIENIHNELLIKLTDLRDLDLSYNEKLNFSDSLLRNVKHLHTLLLSGVRTDFNFLEMNGTELSTVIISNADIRNISLLHLGILKYLHILVLSRNNVSKLEVGAFSGINTLSYLDVSFNKINFIQPGVFKDNNNLMWLNISHNSLSEIGYGIFRGLNNLITLDMSYNNIKDLKRERFYEVKRLSKLIVDYNRIDSIIGQEFEGTSLSKLSIGDNPLPCHMLVKLMKNDIRFEVSAIKLDEHNGENIDGITCNKNQENEPSKTNSSYKINDKNDVLLDIRNILYNISSNNTKYLQSIKNLIDFKLTNVADIFNNVTNSLLKEILKSLNKTNVAITTSFSSSRDNNSIGVISYVKEMTKKLEEYELDRKFSMVHHENESFPKSPSNEKFIVTNEVSKSFFTETCVALILIILVVLVVYKIYTERIFTKNRMFFRTPNRLTDDMENSAL